MHARFPGRAVSLDASPQLDLGIDSLAWVELTLEIERRFGRSLGEEAVGRIVTLRDLLQEVVETPEATPAGSRRLTSDRSTGAGWALLRWALYLVDRALMAVVFRLRVEGRGHLPGAGPLLLVANHASYLDPAALAAALPLSRLPEVHWAGWSELMFSTAPMRLVSRACRVFPLDPKRGGLAGLTVAQTLHQRQQIVVWFPEGARSRDGRLQPFSAGIGLLMARTGVTAVPVYIQGSFEAWPVSRRLPRPRRISVVFGRPVQHNQLKEGAREDVDRHIADQLRRAVATLAHDERQEH